MSSPATYSRCCTNSTEWPKNGLLCIPEMKPSTTCRARRSSREMRAMVCGWRKRRGSSSIAVATGLITSLGDDGELLLTHRSLVTHLPPIPRERGRGRQLRSSWRVAAVPVIRRRWPLFLQPFHVLGIRCHHGFPGDDSFAAVALE